MTVILLGLAVVVVTVGIPLGLLFAAVWMWRKGGWKRIPALTVAALVGTYWYFIYLALYPPDSFYRDEFLTITGLAFPRSGKIVYSDASFPDLFGDYSSCAIIEVSDDDYFALEAVLSDQPLITGDPMETNCDRALRKMRGIMSYRLKTSARNRTREDQYVSWGLTSGAEREVVIQQVTW